MQPSPPTHPALTNDQCYVVGSICSKVFARMTPDEKERLCLALKDSGKTCMMCGDGANDVGALKQAQVRLSLSASVVCSLRPRVYVLVRMFWGFLSLFSRLL